MRSASPAPDAASDVKGPKKKTPLTSTQKRDICIYADENPDAKQADICTKWDIDRSTVSKILKHKTQWLAVQPGETVQIVRDRFVNFPAIGSLAEIPSTGLPSSLKSRTSWSTGSSTGVIPPSLIRTSRTRRSNSPREAARPPPSSRRRRAGSTHSSSASASARAFSLATAVTTKRDARLRMAPPAIPSWTLGRR